MMGTVLAVSVFIAVMYVTWRVRPTALNAMACGLLTVLLLGPVSWAGYTLFLLPFLFSRKWDRITWTAVILLAAPFSPHDAVSSVSQTSSRLSLSIPPVRSIYEALSSAGGWAGSLASNAATGFGEPMSWLWNAPVRVITQLGETLEPVGAAILASIYVWAVLLLLARVLWEQTRAHSALVPYRANLPSGLRRTL
jgi:hypothetical protein